MKYIVLLLFIFSLSQAKEKEQTITIGLGLYTQTQPYANVDTLVLPSPVVFFDNELFYIRWTRAGVYFLGNKSKDFSWGLSLTAQPRTNGYKSSDIVGMNERKSSLEGGLALSVESGDTFFEALLLTDIIDRHDTWVLQSELGHEFKFSKLSIYPSVLLRYQSSAFMNYYYGVTAAEAVRRGETTYTPSAGLQVSLQTYITYPLTKNIDAFINIRADKLPIGATSSTIVQDKYVYSGLASLIYTFDY
ncbi:MipA/OmpV family protein [Sulfurimonas sp. SAG-AH-194-I05]|nr:MipA/OmpV family protein [Sulfurimonas sp. SAG-AH-194-I05]MDF1875180.1 MipA/OmpV family protein [Sulfurimonas sp. SAG-AH-194-I05]